MVCHAFYVRDVRYTLNVEEYRRKEVREYATEKLNQYGESRV